MSDHMVGPSAGKTIAMLGSWPPIRGLSSYCLALSSALAKQGRVICLSFKAIYPRRLYPGGGLRDDPTFPELAMPRLQIERRLAWYNPLGWLTAGFLTRADLLHAQWWSLPLAPIYLSICQGFRMRGRPVVITVHNVLPHDPSVWFMRMSRLLFGLCDHFVVHTRINRRQLMTHYGIARKRIHLIPHGLLDFHVRKDADRTSIRQAMGFHPDHQVVLLFGAIRPYKGIFIALEAFARVHRRLPHTRLLIAGKLWMDWAPYAARIDELGLGDAVVTWLDYVPSGEVFRFFSAADLALLPYQHFDSQSGVGATAVSFGVPMIVSHVGGLPDLVRDHRWVVPPGRVIPLADALYACLSDPDALASMAADTRMVARELDWATIAENTWDLYNRLI